MKMSSLARIVLSPDPETMSRRIHQAIENRQQTSQTGVPLLGAADCSTDLGMRKEASMGRKIMRGRTNPENMNLSEQTIGRFVLVEADSQ